MKMRLVVLTTLVVATWFPVVVLAECHKAQVCDDYGNNCQVQDICDSNIDLPSIELPPLRPLPSMELKPLPSMELPPIGTSHCEYEQVNGDWVNVCH